VDSHVLHTRRESAIKQCGGATSRQEAEFIEAVAPVAWVSMVATHMVYISLQQK
jgi:hypothetical protein